MRCASEASLSTPAASPACPSASGNLNDAPSRVRMARRVGLSQAHGSVALVSSVLTANRDAASYRHLFRRAARCRVVRSHHSVDSNALSWLLVVPTDTSLDCSFSPVAPHYASRPTDTRPLSIHLRGAARLISTYQTRFTWLPWRRMLVGCFNTYSRPQQTQASRPLHKRPASWNLCAARNKVQRLDANSNIHSSPRCPFWNLASDIFLFKKNKQRLSSPEKRKVSVQE